MGPLLKVLVALADSCVCWRLCTFRKYSNVKFKHRGAEDLKSQVCSVTMFCWGRGVGRSGLVALLFLFTWFTLSKREARFCTYLNWRCFWFNMLGLLSAFIQPSSKMDNCWVGRYKLYWKTWCLEHVSFFVSSILLSYVFCCYTYS